MLVCMTILLTFTCWHKPATRQTSLSLPNMSAQVQALCTVYGSQKGKCKWQFKKQHIFCLHAILHLTADEAMLGLN